MTTSPVLFGSIIFACTILLFAMNEVKEAAKEVLWPFPDNQPPVQNMHPKVWDMVLSDMASRKKKGESTYGVALQPFNGRNALVDAYEEILDLAVYLRQKLYEDENS